MNETVPHGPHFVLSASGEIHGEDTPENREMVRRLHACVAACEGISTEELENGIVQDMQRVIAEVVPLLQGQDESHPAALDSMVIDTASAAPVSQVQQ